MRWNTGSLCVGLQFDPPRLTMLLLRSSLRSFGSMPHGNNPFLPSEINMGKINIIPLRLLTLSVLFTTIYMILFFFLFFFFLFLEISLDFPCTSDQSCRYDFIPTKLLIKIFSPIPLDC